MATALLRLIPFLLRILNANSLFQRVEKLRKVKNVIFTKKDIISLVEKSKKFKDFLKKELETNLKSNCFIFFSEQELIDYVKLKDADAKIVKLIELNECSLYLVEGRVFSNKWQGLLNTFMFALLYNQFNTFFNTLKANILAKYDYLNNELIKMENKILNELEKQKQNDIANTYCINCCCSCSCEEGSCSCCCSCSLVHYIQSWDNLGNYIKQQFSNYKTILKDALINEQKQDSLLNQFFLLWGALMNFFFTRVKEKYLFCVLNEKYLKEEFKKELHKKGILKFIYEFLRKNFYGKKIEYNKLIKILKKALEWEFKREFTKKQIQQYLSKIDKRYIKLNKYKIDNDNNIYVVVVGCGKSRRHK